MKQVLFLLLGLVFISCNIIDRQREKGSGKVIEQNRTVENFNNVSVSSALEIHISQGNTHSVRVKTDDNLQSFVEVYTEGNELFVEQKENTSLDPTGDIEVYITLPNLENLEVSGANDVVSDNAISSDKKIRVSVSGASSVALDLNAPQIDSDISGASKVTLKGKTKDLKLEGSGASKFSCFDLMTENTDVDITGASKAEVFASVSLKASTSGASTVEYKGEPTVNSDVSGAGSVKKAN